MKQTPAPWRLIPNHIRGQGGREIDRFRGIVPAVDTLWGSEAWIGSVTRVANPPQDQPDYGCSQVRLPDGRELFLYQAIAEDPKGILGAKHLSRTPQGLGMLIKYLDAHKQYGLQCHPTRAWAREKFNSPYGKEESWYVIGTREDTEKPAYILLGFKQGVTRADWESAYYRGDIPALENLCHRIEVKVGETYFVGAGCPHALGEGCFVIEVQEPADITLGAHPFTKGTEAENALNNERLIGAYDFNGCSAEENLRRWRIPPQLLREGSWGKEEILIGPEQTRFFSFTRLQVEGEAFLRATGFPQVAIVQGGEGVLYYEGGSMDLHKADELFLPCNLPGAKVAGDAILILCHPEGVEYHIE